MWKYEKLMSDHDYLNFTELDNFPPHLDGYIVGSDVYINKNLTPQKKHEIIAEEITHYHINEGNILDQSDFNNRKFENYARRKTMEKLITLQGIIDAFNNDCSNLYETSNFFEVSEDFVQQSIAHLKRKNGLSTFYGNYLITFEPLRVFEYTRI